jgi:hypothetical protein
MKPGQLLTVDISNAAQELLNLAHQALPDDPALARLAQQRQAKALGRLEFEAALPPLVLRAMRRASPGSWLGPAIRDDRPQRVQAAARAEDPAALFTAVCRGLGIAGTTGAVGFDEDHLVRVAADVLTGAQFLEGLQHLDGDRQARLGAARLFFEAGFSERLPVEAARVWAPVLAEAALTDGDPRTALAVLDGLERYPGPAARVLLQRVARGELAVQAAPEPVLAGGLGSSSSTPAPTPPSPAAKAAQILRAWAEAPR